MSSKQNTKIAYIGNTGAQAGVGVRHRNIKKCLVKSELSGKVVDFYLDGQRNILSKNGRSVGWVKSWPGVLGTKSLSWIRLGSKLRKYVQQTDKNECALWHATNQTLSFLGSNLRPMIVTVHDIIEMVEPQNKKAYLINKYLYGGIAKADYVIAVSQFTAAQVKEFYGLSDEKIKVVYNGVADSFKPIENFTGSVAQKQMRHEMKVPDKSKIVLYVGSDHKRKNVIGAVQVFNILREKNPNLVFIKVGEPGLPEGRESLLKEVDNLGIRQYIRFVGRVTDSKLNELYNLADVLVYPSRFEGFGFPPLEAMAAGLPVVTSNATSLPEVVGDDNEYGEQAAVMCDPDDIEGMAKRVDEILTQSQVREEWSRKGISRAKKFSWNNAADEIMKIYEELL